MASKNLMPLSPSETEILRLLWQLGQGTVQDVCNNLPPGRQIAYATVQTMLRRLEKKGYIKRETRGKAHVFMATARRNDVINSAVTSFLDKLFGGDPVPLMQYLAQHGDISPADIDRLKELTKENQND